MTDQEPLVTIHMKNVPQSLKRWINTYQAANDLEYAAFLAKAKKAITIATKKGLL